jgi:ABC-type multidrug transport system permease subunit
MMTEIILCSLGLIFIVMFAIRTFVGFFKIMYELAPLVVLLGAMISVLYFVDTNSKEGSDAGNIESAKIESTGGRN